MTGLLLHELASASEDVAATAARLGKVERLAAVLARAEPDEAAAAVAFLSGELRQRQIGVGWASLREVPAPATSAALRVGEVDAIFDRVGRQAGANGNTILVTGPGSVLRGDLILYLALNNGTGNVVTVNNSGSITSRLRVRMDIAAKNVPFDTNAQVPRTKASTNW